ncbi:hypothetical protein F5I97DRAFT_1869326 [Phlebopus sp. FC_14]|nr:hypothetical protein F5I97DRAFT_1869326 [Phlebopus sp. FC_14]
MLCAGTFFPWLSLHSLRSENIAGYAAKHEASTKTSLQTSQNPYPCSAYSWPQLAGPVFLAARPARHCILKIATATLIVHALV